MAYLKRASFLIMGLLLFALAACSANIPAYANTSGQTAQQTGQISQYNVHANKSQSSGHKASPAVSKPNGMQVASQQSDGGSSHMGGASATIVIHTAMVTINGKTTTILTTANGRTLYYRTSDPAPASTCTGACAKAWPPLIANGKLIVPLSLQGHMSVYKTANGNQVEFNGHPLYTYAGDMASGQFSGQGLGGVWYVAAIGQQQPQPQGTPQPSHW